MLSLTYTTKPAIMLVDILFFTITSLNLNLFFTLFTIFVMFSGYISMLDSISITPIFFFVTI